MAEESAGSNVKTSVKRKYKARGSRLPSTEELIRQGNDMLKNKSTKKRKTHEYEYSTNPVTGLRCNKGTYTGQKKKKEVTHIQDVEEESDDLEEMKDLMANARKLLDGWQSAPRRQTWVEREFSLHESWEESRQSLYEALLKASFSPPEDEICKKCFKETAVIKCRDPGCSQFKYLCGICDQKCHEYNIFHDRDALMEGHFVPISTMTSKNLIGEWVTVGRSLPPSSICCPFCNSLQCSAKSTLQETHCIFVGAKGRFDINHRGYDCKSCGMSTSTSNPIVVTQLGFWPGSISDMTYVFDQDLFLYWDLLQKQIPGISECSFIKSLEAFSKEKGRVSTINATSFRTSFREWKYCQFEVNTMKQINWMECPACSETQRSVHVDGNMKLYRFKSAGMKKRDSYYKETFIADNEKVDAHIHNVYKGSKQKNIDDVRCGESNWRAAANSLNKKKNVSETGLEIAGCRHALAQHAVNMMYGEVYGYAHYLQITYFIPKKVKFLWYDVICKYWPWLRKHDKDTSLEMKPALSVMHAKAHAWYCQTIWGGRWQQGAAATTGEEVEHINSHFSRLGSSTKHMCPEAREELLTEHALSWNRRKIESLPRALARRYTRAQHHITQIRVELDKELEQIGTREENTKGWKDDVLVVAKEKENEVNKKPKMSPEEEIYIHQLSSLGEKNEKEAVLYDIACDMYRFKMKRPKVLPSGNLASGADVLMQKAIRYLSQQVEHLHYSITQMAFNMGKFTDGSKQRKRLRKKITSEKVKLEGTISRYNDLASDHIQLQDIEQGHFPWQIDVQKKDVTQRAKRLVVDKLMEIERFQEESELLTKEMMAFLKFYKDEVLPSLTKQREQLQCLLDIMDDTSLLAVLPVQTRNLQYSTTSTERLVVTGKLALTMDGIAFAKHQIAAGIDAFAPLLSSELGEFRQILLTNSTDGDDDSLSDNEEDVNGDDDTDDETDALESDDIVVALEDNKKKTGDAVLDALGSLRTMPVQTMSGEEIVPGIACWKFPTEISQSTYNGRNGSNACSLIALLIGYTFWKSQLALPELQAPLTSTVIDTLCGCIELGNRVYDLCRASLPSRYLSIQEAASVLHMWFDSSVGDGLPVRLQDQHQLSTISAQLEQAISCQVCAAFLIIDEKSSLFFLTADSVMYINTHRHHPSGAVLTMTNAQKLKELCTVIWNLEGYSERTFGNLVLVEF